MSQKTKTGHRNTQNIVYLFAIPGVNPMILFLPVNGQILGMKLDGQQRKKKIIPMGLNNTGVNFNNILFAAFLYLVQFAFVYLWQNKIGQMAAYKKIVEIEIEIEGGIKFDILEPFTERPLSQCFPTIFHGPFIESFFSGNWLTFLLPPALT